MASSMLFRTIYVADGFLVSYVVMTLLTSPLKHIPGPFLAVFTNLWRLYSLLRRNPHIIQRKLHDQLGPVVRLGPNMVSVADPALIPEIYSRKNVLTKGDFYEVFGLNVHGKLFEGPLSTRNEQTNTQALKPVAHLFTMSQMIKLEPLIDKTIECFLHELTRRFALPGKPCDIDQWLPYCAWDVIGEVTYSKRLGFLEQGKDVDSIIADNVAAHNYISAVGMMPWLDHWLKRNPVKRTWPLQYGPIIKVMQERIQSRISGKEDHDRTVPDMLDGFIDAAIAEDKLFGYMFANTAAGTDTVATELRSIVYHLCKNRDKLQKLYKELDDAALGVPVPWNKCQQLPYLSAVISEACRLMPGIGLPLERRLGPSGLLLSDNKTVLPPGTVVGINPYVINRDKSVFGDDAEDFRPERWLRDQSESEVAYQERLGRMRATDMTFGAGKRSCLGRNLALIEMYKIAASFFCAFDVELIDPEKEWRVHNAWLLYPSEIDVRLRRRG